MNRRIRQAFIFGGSSGIGLAAAVSLARKHSQVTLFARDPDRLAAAAETVRDAAGEESGVFTTAVDVASWSGVKAAVDGAVNDHGVPDLLLNCAGRAIPGRFEEITPEMAGETLRVNLMGTIHTTYAVVPHMKARGSGIIVNTASVAGLIGVFGYTDYCASKFGVIGFSEALRSEMKPHGIRVQVLCPPDTDTPGLAAENRTKPEETQAISANAKLLTAEQVADALARGLDRGDFLIIPGFEARMVCRIKRWFPQLVAWIMDRTIRSIHRSRKPADTHPAA